MGAVERRVQIYRTPDGREPFTSWMDGLRDLRARQKVQARIARMRLGNLGHTRSLGEGVHEMKIDYGPGYRVYFGLDGPTLVILLCGGAKGTQSSDIRAASSFLKQYKQERDNADR